MKLSMTMNRTMDSTLARVRFKARVGERLAILQMGGA
jgi:hypothetical protein